MRRDTLIKALERVRSDLIACELNSIFQGLMEGRRENKERSIPSGLFSAYQEYIRRTSAYDSNHLYILSVFDLNDLLNPDWWHRVVVEPDALQHYWPIRQSISFVIDQAPKLITMISQKGVEEALKEKSLSQVEKSNFEPFSIVLIEDDEENSKPERIIQCLDAVDKIYKTLAEIRGLSSESLVILACDSGSDKSFDFLGVADLVREIRKCFAGLFNYRLLNRQVQTSANIALLSQALPIVAEIDELRKAGSLTDEQAERLRHTLLKSASQFLECGAITSDMENQQNSPRLVMRPEPKLLSGPTAQNNEYPEHQSGHEGEASAQLSPEELKRMREILSDADGSENKSPPSKRGPISKSRKQRQA